jgi:hypothetical protein
MNKPCVVGLRSDSKIVVWRLGVIPWMSYFVGECIYTIDYLIGRRLCVQYTMDELVERRLH